mmetsp:Transcript_40482/g.89949  ORF Transcript_40482/g.89949 Transcript_40482/m.89949 type:complete len:508 (-) Transcript_40482:699-2222(-)|eukprot:CAMPEP_0202921552 /NCGR_PEP_ID=MMETSP1392-20130828/77452_1 /ASSEMBLY_ACC=CAM_ASM_000868 /TAXON_ID=225041 /ORGANISM="Chlamydomonas chlamydogama, Strain SAG 11-48b" /LENGTH=507 /DNA_ID=CAMNT_0049615127 /DNA_START=129 /DNA_END=1652 /DNA_ORIENTATION=+
MADTLLEQTRALHEDMERLERLIVKDFKQETKTHKEKLMQNHRVRKRLDVMQEAARKLVRIYEDDDGARKEEIAAIAQPDSGSFAGFYDRLKEIRDYHRKFPSNDVTEAENDEAALKEEPHVDFTGEEGLGRYLDLHEHFMRFVNSKFGKKLEYNEYVSGFGEHLTGVPKSQKSTKQYRDYLQQLCNYLKSFYERTQPLAQAQRQFAKMEEDVRGQWDAGTLPGWEDRGLRQISAADAGSGLDLQAFDSSEELETIGADRLKEALQALGLKCGGTPKERAQRLFLTKSTPLEQLDKKLFAKGVVAPSAQRSEEDIKKLQEGAFQVALLEARTQQLSELLRQVLADTKGRVEKKQAQTYEEMQAEQEEAEAELAPEDEDEEDAYVYNPLKLPLGWDGKPIPYWLYKLHGLNQEFKCEICGNHSYWGRRAFEKHFKEWRHQNGMRALGIPNNKNFYEVTKIDDAVALWKSMQDRGKGGFNPEIDEEFEDASGNVYNKKTYEDLKRQGII